MTARQHRAQNAWWDSAPSSAQEERYRKIEALFDSLDHDDDYVIRKEEFVAALTVTEVGKSVWGLFSPEKAAALFDEIDVTKTGKVTKAKFGHHVCASPLGTHAPCRQAVQTECALVTPGERADYPSGK